MSQPAGNCPSCGAPVQFRWSSAVQTVCPFCRSIIVRDDIALHNVGKVGDLPPGPSPICLLTEGVYRGKGFQVIGRIIYEWENGGWNEWHLVFSDGTSGWLSDAQLQYAVSFAADRRLPVPAENQAVRGAQFRFGDIGYQVSTVTRAMYRGVEGELPFAYYDKTQMTFADLRTSGRAFATLDFSEQPPLLFLGEWVAFEELQLKNLRQFEGWA
jgi:hypothetical protein